MGEYAYDFTGENAHDGACRNPHDTARMSGGSSSGCGAATAAGLAPVSLGSDTNGSLRVPASLCGVFSLKPTFGRLPRTGTFPFVDSLDHLGPIARTVRDLALAYDALQGPMPATTAARRARSSRRAGPRRGPAHGCASASSPAGSHANAGPAGPRRGRRPRRGARARTRIVPACARRSRGGPRRRLSPHQRRERGLPPRPAPGARRRFRSRDPRPLPRRRAAAGRLGGAGTARPALVACPRPRRSFATFDLLVPRDPLPGAAQRVEKYRAHRRPVPLRPTLGLLAQPFSCIGLPVVTAPVFAKGRCRSAFRSSPALGRRERRSVSRASSRSPGWQLRIHRLRWLQPCSQQLRRLRGGARADCGLRLHQAVRGALD